MIFMTINIGVAKVAQEKPMNFSAPYQVLGQADSGLVETVCSEIQKMNDEYYNYVDYDSKSGNPSWHRLDFTLDGYQHERERALYEATKSLVQDTVGKFQLDELSSFSVSMLKPNEILEEHTDSRLIHRLTNRYIIPLIDGGGSYNYWVVNGQRVKYYLKRGEVFRVNNAIIHSAVNSGNIERYNILIDTFSTRLRSKFRTSIDLNAPMSREGHNFSVARKAHNSNDKKIPLLMEKLRTDPNFRI